MTRLMMVAAALLFGSIGAEAAYVQSQSVTLGTYVTDSSSNASDIVLVAGRNGRRYGNRSNYRSSQRSYTPYRYGTNYPSYRYPSNYYGSRSYDYGNRGYYYGNRGYSGGVRVGPVQVWW